MDQTDSAGGWGLSLGYSAAPLFSDYAYSVGEHMLLAGNDYEGEGGGTSAVIPDGTVLVDHRVVVMWLHSESWADSSDEFAGLLTGSLATTVGADVH